MANLEKKSELAKNSNQSEIEKIKKKICGIEYDCYFVDGEILFSLRGICNILGFKSISGNSLRSYINNILYDMSNYNYIINYLDNEVIHFTYNKTIISGYKEEFIIILISTIASKFSNKNILGIQVRDKIKKQRVKSDIIYTYIVRDCKNNIYKIGKTHDIYKRLSSLKTSNINLLLIAYVNSDIESEIHTYLSDNRILNNREWFKLNDNDVRNIISRFSFNII
jgi:hypothetical protein|nr:MAG TPA: Meiotically up-regulated protein 113 [Caudoviricetes sp.]